MEIVELETWEEERNLMSSFEASQHLFPVLILTPRVITHIRGADPLGSPATVSRHAGLRPVVLRPTLSSGLPFSSLNKILRFSKNFEFFLMPLVWSKFCARRDKRQENTVRP